jgi:glutathione synthase/RimK-type ligase-like ATP-grasp enzyme
MRTVGLMTTHAYWPQETSIRDQPYAPHQVDALNAALAQHGIRLEPVFWEDEGQDWGRFDAVSPLLSWGYPQSPARFDAALREVEAAGVLLLNDEATVRTNMDKGYLADLARRGAPVPPTLEWDLATPELIAAAFDRLGCEEIVVKPRIGAGAWRQARIRRGQAVPAREDLPPAGALVQPFLPAVASEGELSLLVFGGEVSHALIKRPKAGDYRTQGHHGATEMPVEPPDDAMAAAAAVLDIADPKRALLYARVDLVRGAGGWLLMELELIEPYLYLPFDGSDGAHGAKVFARALAARL